jgi:hypothetical protein
MYHPIEFCTGFTADVEISPRQRLERVRVRKGLRVYAHLLPYVVETAQCPVEVADLCFEDGSVTRQIPYGNFRFLE